MNSMNCQNCGAQLDVTVRFCRRCGHPSSLLEATTAPFNDPPATTTPTQPMSPGYTAPSFMPPTPLQQLPPQYMQPPPDQAVKKTALWVLASLVGVLLLALVGVVLFFTLGPAQSPVKKVVVMAPAPEAIPAVPQIPPIPAPPPPPVISIPGSEGGSPISERLVYPGSERLIEASRGEEGSFVQLSTTDEFRKVLNWYVAQLKPNKNVTLPGGTALLEAGNVVVLINPTGSATMITVTQKPPQ
jgi:hypothetical protein